MKAFRRKPSNNYNLGGTHDRYDTHDTYRAARVFFLMITGLNFINLSLAFATCS